MPTAEASHRAYLGLGGNIGDPVASMREALARLDAHAECHLIGVSRLYRTPPWGKTDQDWFFNAAACLETRLTPPALLDLCLSVELALKRVRTERWGPRTIDIDVIAYDSLTYSDERLTVPHARAAERAFVLMPIADLDPDLVIGGSTVNHWLESADRTGIEVADSSRNWWKA